MRSHAKASPAGSTLRQAAGLGRIVRGDVATRGGSGDADGSGTPSSRHLSWASALIVAAASLFLLAAAPLAQARYVSGGFGTTPPLTERSPALGGQFWAPFGPFPNGVAVNTSGNGAPAGTVYATDGFGNRIERFSPSGAFQRAWGQDVIAASVDEQQKLLIRASGGSYTLTFKGDTTDPIPYNGSDSGSIVQSRLAELPSIGGSANVEATTAFAPSDRRIVIVTFKGALGASDQPLLSVDASQLVGTVKVSTPVPGLASTSSTGTGVETCTIAGECKAGLGFEARATSLATSTAHGGQVNDPQGVAVDQTSGNVYVTENVNRRVSEFDPDGNFIRAWGWDVIASGEPNDTGTGFEICTVASECKRGAEGAGGGEFAFSSLGGIGQPVIDSSGDVWVPDAQNRRIQEFDSSGNFIVAYGYDVDALGGGGALESCTSTAPGACRAGAEGSAAGQFSGVSPDKIAFDSAGNVYALDIGNKRVQKFNPTLTTPSVFGASTFSTYTTKAPTSVTSIQGGTRLVFGVENDVSGGGEGQLLEIDPTDASVKDTSLVGGGLLRPGNGLPSITALAYDSGNDKLYTATPSPTSPRVVLTLTTTQPPAPTVTLKPVLDKTDTTASFNAIVDPGNGLAFCKFQYSTDQSNWTDVSALDCESLVPGGGTQGVSETLVGLTPNTHYFVRLQVSRPLVSNSTVTTPLQSFDTDAPPPVVTNVGAAEVTDTSARMVGTIDPRHSDTSYVFQYGTTPSLGFETAPLNVGSGSAPVTVSQVVGGLHHDTTYYFRLVATNLTGSTASSSHTLHTRANPLPPANPGNCSNEALRQAQSSAYLPDCRAYEQVSPPDKNQGDSDHAPVGLKAVGFARDGNSAGFCTAALFGEPPSQMTGSCAPYVSQRGAGGWSTFNPFPPYCSGNLDDPGNVEGQLGAVWATLSPNLDKAVMEMPESESCAMSPLDPAAPMPADNLYLEDVTSDPTDYQLLTPNPNDEIRSISSLSGRVVGGDDHFSHVIIDSTANQSADSPTPQEHFNKLYDWHEGALALITRNENDDPFTTSSQMPGNQFRGELIASAVSRDGSRIYFQNRAQGPQGAGCSTAACDLYLREDDTTTLKVSESECTVECGVDSSPDRFLGAIPSGEKAFFDSCAKLTNEANPPESCLGVGSYEQGQLYRWDRNAPPGQHLVDLTVDHEPSDGLATKTYGLLGISDDGNTAYFVAHSQLVAGETTATEKVGIVGSESIEKIYRWRWNGGSPTLDYLGFYNPSFYPLYYNFEPNLHVSSSDVTPDGRYLVIVTPVRLDPVADTDDDNDVYRWDEEEGWACVSCQQPGIPSAGGADAARKETLWNFSGHTGGQLRDYEPIPRVSDDGQRIFFETPDALVPGDVNGEAGCQAEVSGGHIYNYECDDVYEWHDGTVALVSSGTAGGSKLIGATRSGNDVFFVTRNHMVGWDLDNGSDIYDARVGGGFPEPPAQPASCEGEACRGASTVGPAAAGAGTAAFEGPGNPKPSHGKPRKHHKRHHKNHRRQAHRHERGHGKRARNASYDRRAAR